MKRLLVILFILIFGKSFSQPVTPGSGPSFTIQDARKMFQYNAFLPRYQDTVYANLQRGIDSCGAIIYTYNYGLWYRSCYNGSKKWVQIFPSGNPTSDTLAWKLEGNTIGGKVADPVFGTLDVHPINFITNGTQRMILGSGGFLSNTARVKGIGIDSVTLEMSYVPTATSVAWSLTGNSGTTAGTNYLGTNDAVNLQLRTSGSKRFTINTSGAFGLGTGEDYGTSGYVLKTQGSGAAPTWVDPASFAVNIYNSDGTISGNRTVNVNNKVLAFNDVDAFDIYDHAAANNRLSINSSTGITELNGASGLIQSSTITLNDTIRISALLRSYMSVGTYITINPHLGKLYIDTLTNAVGTKALRYNPTTGLVTYADTTIASTGLTVGTTTISSGTNPYILYNNSGVLGNLPVTGSTNVVMSNSPTIVTPTITTSATVPLVIGGTGTTSSLILKTTTGVGTTNADMIFQVGNNGATEAMRILNSGNVGIGTTSPDTLLTVNGSIKSKLLLVNAASGFTGNLLDLQLNGTTLLKSSANGEIYMNGPSYSLLRINVGGSQIGLLGTIADGIYLGNNNTDNNLTVRASNGFIGAGTTSPTSKFHVNGSFATAYVAKTANYTATSLDHTIDCTSGTFTVTLPTAASITGRQYTIVNSGSGTITIATTSSQTFTNINATPTTLSLAAVGAGAIVSYTVVSNGANWIVVSKVKNE